MNQKRVANIVLIVLVVVAAGTVGYLTLVKRSPQSAIPAPTSISTSTPTLTSMPSSTATSTVPPSNFHQVTFQDFDLRCLGTGGSREFVVHTQAEYQRLIDASPDLHPNPFLPCVDYKFPAIDFTQKTLLGKSTMGGGCSSEIKKMVWRNDNSREVIYSITANFIGACEMAIFHNNFILVSKIPEDYVVKFEVNSRSDL